MNFVNFYNKIHFNIHKIQYINVMKCNVHEEDEDGIV